MTAANRDWSIGFMPIDASFSAQRPDWLRSGSGQILNLGFAAYRSCGQQPFRTIRLASFKLFILEARVEASLTRWCFRLQEFNQKPSKSYLERKMKLY